MANRHSHKKLRAEIRARMVAKGESYQTARQRIVSRRTEAERSPEPDAVDLVAATYFGVPIAVATYARGSSIDVVWLAGNGPVGRPYARHMGPKGVQ